MRRRIAIDEVGFELLAERQLAAESVDQFVRKSSNSRSKSCSTGKKAIERIIRDVREWSKTDIKIATPTQLVALYYLCHSEIYGSEPIELVGSNWNQACISVGKMIKQDFGGNSIGVVEFVRWVWRREQWRETHRSGDKPRWRITWQQQFAKRNLLSDYRAEMARAGKATDLLVRRDKP
jgi:hypothetical protein